VMGEAARRRLLEVAGRYNERIELVKHKPRCAVCGESGELVLVYCSVSHARALAHLQCARQWDCGCP